MSLLSVVRATTGCMVMKHQMIERTHVFVEINKFGVSCLTADNNLHMFCTFCIRYPQHNFNFRDKFECRTQTPILCFFVTADCQQLRGQHIWYLSLDKIGAILVDDIFNCIFLDETYIILIQFSLQYVLKSPIDNKPALVQVMDRCQTGDKPLPGLLMTQFIDAYMQH